MPLEKAIITGIMFQLENALPVPDGKVMVHIYPQIAATIPIWERKHAFHINKSAVVTSTIMLYINHRMRLSSLGRRKIVWVDNGHLAMGISL